MITQAAPLRTQSSILIAMGLGIACGLLDIALINNFAHILSALFIQLLKLISLPIIFFAILATITNLKGLDELKQIGQSVLRYTLLTTLLAAMTAAFLFWAFNLSSPAQDLAVTAATIQKPSGQYFDFLLKIIPENAIQAFLDGNVIGIAFMAFLISVATIQLPSGQRETLQRLFSALFSALLQITQIILRWLPIGIWAFMLILVQGLSSATAPRGLLFYLLAVVCANLIQGFIILPLLLRANGLPFLKTFKGMFPALSMAFFSKSSSTTMPLTIQCAENNLQVRPKIAQTSLPLCSIINMNGCAAFIYITTLFIASQAGMQFDLFDMMAWILIATLAAVGNAGVPMGCYFLTSALLISLGVELELLALILPLYTFLDMLETSLNVWSDACVTTIVDKNWLSSDEKNA